jgi:hypothetical protein
VSLSYRLLFLAAAVLSQVSALALGIQVGKVKQAHRYSRPTPAAARRRYAAWGALFAGSCAALVVLVIAGG